MTARPAYLCAARARRLREESGGNEGELAGDWVEGAPSVQDASGEVAVALGRSDLLYNFQFNAIDTMTY